jgi:hypothetical protein
MHKRARSIFGEAPVKEQHNEAYGCSSGSLDGLDFCANFSKNTQRRRLSYRSLVR